MIIAPSRAFAATARATKPRIGFLGVGWIGRNRLEAIARAGIAEIACIADEHAAALAEARQCARGAATAGSMDELLSHQLDGVVIATPSALHAEQAIAALERGLAVFCQKPLGRTAAEVKRVVEAARQADRLLGVDLSYRFTAGATVLRELIQCGELGQIYAVDLVFHNAYGPDKPWFYDPHRAGGGCVIDLGIHLVDLVLWILDFPAVSHVSSRLFAGGRRMTEPTNGEVEDYAVASFDLANGAVVRLTCSWKLSAGCDAVIQASFYGTRGGASLRNVNGSFYDFIAQRFNGTATQTLVQPPDNWPGRGAVQWVNRLASGERFDPEAARAITVAHVLDAIYGRTP